MLESVERSAFAAVLCTLMGAAVARGAPPKASDDGGTADITFTGFDEHTDGSSRLYVKLSHPVSVEPTYSGKHLEYTLVGARVPIKNNENPLITSHFGAEVVSAQIVVEDHAKGRGKKRGKARSAPLVADAARLVIETREAVKPQHKMLRNSDGSAVLVIDFARPSKTPAPEPDVIAPPPSR
ncbi:MAG TPA: hypothetical protein VHC69_22460 [Polyangiaceae bacterium]|nr:hypothetical protein [Polyangiaceae bacterium]